MNDSQETHTSQLQETGEAAPLSPPTNAPLAEDDACADTVPVPPRYWWLKRIVVVGVILPVALIGSHFGWGRKADRQLQKEIDRIVAKGEPIYPQDFNPKEALPDADNAAFVYIDATASLVLTQDDWSFIANLYDDTDAINKSLSQVRAIVERNPEALALVRKAHKLKRADWGIRMRTPMYSVPLPYLSGQREVGRFILATSLLRWKEGNSREAFALLEDALVQARTVDTHPSLIGHLVAIAESSLLWKAIETMLPDLEISSETKDANHTAIPRSQVVGLIEQLRNEEGSRAAMVLALQTERASLVDTICAVADGQISIQSIYGGAAALSPWIRSFVARVIRPALHEDALYSLKRLSRTVSAGMRPTWPKARVALPTAPPNWTGIDRLIHKLSTGLEPSLGRVFVLHYRAIAMRRMTRIALAIRLFEIDHGERPASLENLVPEYLPALPVDPFGDGTQSFGYLPGAVRPRIYSLGPNGTDDAGNVVFRRRGEINMDRADMSFFLDGPRPRSIEDLSTPITQPPQPD